MPIVPENVLKKVQHHVESKFPEMKGVTPKTEKLTLEPEPELYEKLGITLPKARGTQEVVALHYSTKVTTDDGFEINRTVRVLIDGSGTILKMTTSK